MRGHVVSSRYEKMNWGSNACLKLIRLYRLKPELWNTTHALYHSKTRKKAAWQDISRQMNKSLAKVQSKLKSLLSSYRREKSRTDSFLKKGQIYKSKWFAYESFYFLKDKYGSEISLKTEEISDEEEIQVEETPSNILNGNEIFNGNVPAQQNTLGVDSQPTLACQDLVSSNAKRLRLEEHRPPANQTFYAMELPVERDNCDVYCEHICKKLKSYSTRTQNIVQHLFNNVIFEADMGKYDDTTLNFFPSTSSGAFSFANRNGDIYSPSNPANCFNPNYQFSSSAASSHNRPSSPLRLDMA